MKTILTVIMCIATVMVMTACGSGNTKKKSADGSTETAVSATKEKAVKVTDDATANWEKHEFTKQVPMPDFRISSKSESGMGYSVSFNRNTTLEQVKAYAAKVKAAGFNVGATETDGDPYNFTAKNAAGWSVVISWKPNISSITIGKP